MYVWYQNVILGYIDQSLAAYIYIWYASMTCRNPLTRLMFSPIRQMPRRMASALTVKRMRPHWNPIPTFLECPTGRLRSSAWEKAAIVKGWIWRGWDISSSWGWRTWIWVVFFMCFSLTGEPTQGRASLWASISKWCWIFLNHGPFVCAFWGSRLRNNPQRRWSISPSDKDGSGFRKWNPSQMGTSFCVVLSLLKGKGSLQLDHP